MLYNLIQSLGVRNFTLNRRNIILHCSVVCPHLAVLVVFPHLVVLIVCPHLVVCSHLVVLVVCPHLWLQDESLRHQIEEGGMLEVLPLWTK